MSKITRAKWDGGVVQAVEHLLVAPVPACVNNNFRSFLCFVEHSFSHVFSGNPPSHPIMYSVLSNK
jgi:hypothetical protein